MLALIDDGRRSSIASAGPRIEVRTVSDQAGIAAIAEDWQRLERVAPGAVFFQSWRWCMLVMRVLGAGNRRVPRIIVASQTGRVVAIWPLAVCHGLAGRIATDLTEPFGQYSDLLLDPAAPAAVVLEAVFAELATWRIDGLVLRKVRRDATLWPVLAARGRSIGVADAAPIVALADFKSFEDYRQSINAKTRKNLRNYRNRLARGGSVTHQVVTDRAQTSALIARCFAGRIGWLETSGLSSTAFAHPAFARLVLELAGGADPAPPVVVMHLALATNAASAAGGPADLSIQWGFEHNRRYYAFMAARNPAYDACSPGRLHLEDVIAAAAGRGNEIVDLLVPAVGYKQALATDSIAVAGFGVPFTMRGRAFIEGWHGLLRPNLKAALLRLPASMRRRLLKPAAATAMQMATG